LRLTSLGLLCAGIAAAANTPGKVTYHKDVLPILQKNCQSCHRPGEAAPMSFLTYKDTRPWAKAIKTAVLSKKMPPWFADPAHGKFQNERRLSEAELQTVARWVDSGAPEGGAKQAPAPLAFKEGWNIQPDVVFEMPNAYEVPPTGTVEYTYIVIPTGFTKDTWITAAEVRPGDRSVVHHVIASVRPPGSPYLRNVKPGVPFVPVTHERDANGAAIRRNVQAPSADLQRASQAADGAAVVATEFLVGYAPGLQEQRYDLAVPGAGKMIPAGSDIILQMHYTTSGKAASDKTKIGLTLAKEQPKYRYLTLSAAATRLEIPANEAHYESNASVTFKEDAKLVWLMPHMHVRGKDFLYKAVYPTGETQTLLDVPKYDFNWQLGYDTTAPILMPKGTRIECKAHHDNSKNNPYNPNPNVTVKWGDQTWEEMMIGWFAVVVDANVNPRNVINRASRGGE
jgi:hypothetical protein